jgi:orotidine-5'-phosphate decarboxylase
VAEEHAIRFRATHGIVPALDLESPDEILRLVEAIDPIPGLVAYKLGLTLTLRLGLLEAVRRLRTVTALPIIYDHQKAGADLPDMAGKFASTCKAAGVDALILFPLAGPRAVSGFVGAAIEHGLLPIVGGDLPLEDYNAAGGGYVIDDALERIFAVAAGAGATHFVVPGNTPAKVRHHAARLRERLAAPSLFIPGIGALGGSVADTFAAAPGCRVYAVVGRAIFAAADPRAAAQRLAEEASRFA